jgi:S-formylglutathione hydrolase FrmB/lysophospholipase L1-like esterase
VIRLRAVLAAICLLLTVLLWAEEPAAASTEWQQGLELVTHQSELLGKEKQFYIYVPANAKPEERFPVLYIMHGKWGSHVDWPEKANAAKLARNYRMILVFPDGDQFSWYLDSPTMPESQYQSYVAKELVAYIDSHYPTVDDRAARGIMGLSMGGHGAFLIAAKYPDRFGSASSLSGILKLTNHPTREDVIERLGPMEEFPDRWKEYSVWDQAEKFQTANVRLLFDCGEDDTKTGAIVDSRQLHERLTELRVPHIWREHTGTHSWEYWSGHLHEHLNFHQAAMIEKTPLGKWETHYFQRLAKFLDENMTYELDGPGEQKRVALVGSSGIEGMRPAYFGPEWAAFRLYNRGIASDRLGIGPRGITKRLEESVFDFEPDVFILQNGTNDLAEQARSSAGTPTMDRMIEEFSLILDTVATRRPGIPRLVVACSPTRGEKYAHLNPLVVELNERLRTLCAEKQCIYVDVHSKLVDAEGQLTAEFTGDGLHLKEPAARIWIETVHAALPGAVERGSGR